MERTGSNKIGPKRKSYDTSFPRRIKPVGKRLGSKNNGKRLRGFGNQEEGKEPFPVALKKKAIGFYSLCRRSFALAETSAPSV